MHTKYMDKVCSCELSFMSGIYMHIRKIIKHNREMTFSHGFKSASSLILEELKCSLPCEQWLIVYYKHDAWIPLFVLPNHIDNIEVLQPCFEKVFHAGETAIYTHEDNSSTYIGSPIIFNEADFSAVLLGYKPIDSNHLSQERVLKVSFFSELLAYFIKVEFKLNEQRYKIEQLLNLSHTDSLTQLLNHRAWSQMLIAEEARLKRYNHSATIFIIDLDHLKVINDDKGHSAGDQLILRTANCLRAICRESDIVARLGGDEFGLLAVKCDLQGAQSLSRHIALAFETQNIDASVGYCVMNAKMPIKEAVKIADKNMYTAKSQKNKSHSHRRDHLSKTEVTTTS